MSTDQIHTVHPLEVDIPMSRLTVVTGVSGSGKTTMVLESLIPGLEADIKAEKLPAHVKSIEAKGIRQVKLIDAAPIGINVRSTVATYAGVHDELRKYMPERKAQSGMDTKREIFPTTRERFAAPAATGRGRFLSTCSSFRMWMSHAPTAEVPATAKRRTGFCEERETATTTVFPT